MARKNGQGDSEERLSSVGGANVLAYGFICLMPFELAQLGKHVFFGASSFPT